VVTIRTTTFHTKNYTFCPRGICMCFVCISERDKQGTHRRNIDARSHNRCCRGKAISIANSECAFVALVIQHAKRMHSIILSLWAACLYYIFSTLSHKRHDLKKKKNFEHKMCYLIFSTTIFWHISHYKKNSTWYCRKYTCVFGKLSDIVVRF